MSKHTFEIEIPDDTILGPILIVTYFKEDTRPEDQQIMLLATAEIKYDIEGLRLLNSTKEDWLVVVKNAIDAATRMGGN